jgi:sporulation integral membrane protein YlbJ
MKKLFSLKRKKLNYALFLILLFLIITLSIFPERYSKSTYKGVILWGTAVLPSLLPYFFLTALLSKTGVLSEFGNTLTPLTKKPFRLGGISVYAFFTSVLSGYPVGSKIVSDLKKSNAISLGEAHRLSLLCSTSGPLFIIGAVGLCMFKDKTLGFILYITHVLSAILTALIFRNAGGDPKCNFSKILTEKDDNALYDAIYSSVISVLIVGGFVSVFFVVSEILTDFKILYPLTLLVTAVLKPLGADLEIGKAFSVGLIEFTKGSQMLSQAVCPLTVSLSCFLITFGGLSVIMQSLVFLKKANVKTGFFILGKLVQATISGLLCYFSCLIFL